MASQNVIKYFAVLISFGLFIFLANDGRLHWDEPSYLFTGAFLNTDQILTGEYQPSGIDGFYMSRILHVLFIHGVTNFMGTGLATFYFISLCYFVLLLAFILIGYKILQLLSESVENNQKTYFAILFSPIVLYFSFKTMPEIPALFFAAVACYALIKSLLNSSILLLLLCGLAIALTALTKNTMLFMYIGMVGALFLCYGHLFSKTLIIKNSVIAGIASLVFFAIFLALSGISLEQYLAMTDQLAEIKDSYIQRLFVACLEAGIYWIIIPLVFWASRKTAFFNFLMAWFILTTVPLLVLIGHAEARYLANNIIPLAGLTALFLNPALEWFKKLNNSKQTALALVTAISLVTSNLVVLQIMAHEVQYKEIDQAIAKLDAKFGGPKNYSILLPWSYTDFHFLQFAYPEHQVYSVHTIELSIPDSVEKHAPFNAMQIEFIPEFYLDSEQDLSSLKGKPMVYMGFNENFSVANLRAIFDMLPIPNPLDSLGQSKFLDHRSTSWLWENPNYQFSELFHIGHYHVHQLEPKN